MVADYVAEKKYSITEEGQGLNLIYLDYEERLSSPLRHPGIDRFFIFVFS